MTNLDIVSRISNTFNSIDKDSRIPKRYILNIARNKAEFLISQKLGEGSLHREDNIYTTIECFEMIEIPPIKCDIIEFRRCRTVMRSKNKLPKLINSRLGNSIKEITSLDDEREFKPTTPAQFRRDKDREGTSDYIYYYVKNGYPYILDTPIYMINLNVITMEQENIDGCNKDCCKSLWEYEFKCPDKLLDIVITETVKEISIRKGIPTDENPNLNSNEK